MSAEYVIPNANLGIDGFDDIGGITDYAFGKLEVEIDTGDNFTSHGCLQFSTMSAFWTRCSCAIDSDTHCYC